MGAIRGGVMAGRPASCFVAASVMSAAASVAETPSSVRSAATSCAKAASLATVPCAGAGAGRENRILRAVPPSGAPLLTGALTPASALIDGVVALLGVVLKLIFMLDSHLDTWHFQSHTRPSLLVSNVSRPTACPGDVFRRNTLGMPAHAPCARRSGRLFHVRSICPGWQGAAPVFCRVLPARPSSGWRWRPALRASAGATRGCYPFLAWTPSQPCLIVVNSVVTSSIRVGSSVMPAEYRRPVQYSYRRPRLATTSPPFSKSSELDSPLMISVHLFRLMAFCS